MADMHCRHPSQYTRAELEMTVVMGPDMSAAVAREWDDRQRLIQDNPESRDSMWKRVVG